MPPQIAQESDPYKGIEQRPDTSADPYSHIEQVPDTLIDVMRQFHEISADENFQQATSKADSLVKSMAANKPWMDYLESSQAFNQKYPKWQETLDRLQTLKGQVDQSFGTADPLGQRRAIDTYNNALRQSKDLVSESNRLAETFKNADVQKGLKASEEYQKYAGEFSGKTRDLNNLLTVLKGATPDQLAEAAANQPFVVNKGLAEAYLSKLDKDQQFRSEQMASLKGTPLDKNAVREQYGMTDVPTEKLLTGESAVADKANLLREAAQGKFDQYKPAGNGEWILQGILKNVPALGYLAGSATGLLASLAGSMTSNEQEKVEKILAYAKTDPDFAKIFPSIPTKEYGAGASILRGVAEIVPALSSFRVAQKLVGEAFPKLAYISRVAAPATGLVPKGVQTGTQILTGSENLRRIAANLVTAIPRGLLTFGGQAALTGQPAGPQTGPQGAGFELAQTLAEAAQEALPVKLRSNRAIEALARAFLGGTSFVAGSTAGAALSGEELPNVGVEFGKGALLSMASLIQARIGQKPPEQRTEADNELLYKAAEVRAAQWAEEPPKAPPATPAATATPKPPKAPAPANETPLQKATREMDEFTPPEQGGESPADYVKRVDAEMKRLRQDKKKLPVGDVRLKPIDQRLKELKARKEAAAATIPPPEAPTTTQEAPNGMQGREETPAVAPPVEPQAPEAKPGAEAVLGQPATAPSALSDKMQTEMNRLNQRETAGIVFDGVMAETKPYLKLFTIRAKDNPAYGATFFVDESKGQTLDERYKEVVDKFAAAKKSEPAPNVPSLEEVAGLMSKESEGVQSVQEILDKYNEWSPDISSAQDVAAEVRSLLEEGKAPKELQAALDAFDDAQEEYQKNGMRDDDGSDAFMDAVEAATRPSKPRKQPWEMTREEYYEKHRDDIVPRATPTGKQGKLRREDINYVHRNIITSAVERGEVVPPEVLKDYPDLVKKGEKPASEKMPWDMTPEEIGRAYMRVNEREGQGSSDMSAVRNYSNEIAKIASRLTKDKWVASVELAPKDRKGKVHRAIANDALKFLRQLGYATVAWDKEGNPFYSRADSDVPSHLTTEWKERKPSVEVPSTNAAAIRQMLERGKTDGEIRTALNIGQDQIEAVREQARKEKPKSAPEPEEHRLSTMPPPLQQAIKDEAKNLLTEATGIEVMHGGISRADTDLGKPGAGEVTSRWGNKTLAPDWFQELGRSKDDVIKNLQKIIEDDPKNKLALELIDKIIEFKTQGRFESGYVEQPGDPEFAQMYEAYKKGEKSAPEPKEQFPPGVNPNDISLQRATEAYRWNSMTPEVRGKQEQEGYVSHMKDVWGALMAKAKTDAQKEVARQEFERYRASYVSRYMPVLDAKSRTASVMVTGGSNFPTARNQKRLDTERRRWEEFSEWEKRTLSAIHKAIALKATEEAGGEIGVARAKTEKLAALQETMVAANKIVRDSRLTDEQKVSRIADLGIGKANAAELLKPDFAGRLGFADYQLRNNLANLKKTRERIAELERREARPATEIEFDGGYITENAQIDRVQIVFDKKPSPEMIAKLKARGFRWSPRENAWQRQRTDNALRDAKAIIGVKEQPERQSLELTAPESGEKKPLPKQEEMFTPEEKGQAKMPEGGITSNIPLEQQIEGTMFEIPPEELPIIQFPDEQQQAKELAALKEAVVPQEQPKPTKAPKYGKLLTDWAKTNVTPDLEESYGKKFAEDSDAVIKAALGEILGSYKGSAIEEVEANLKENPNISYQTESGLEVTAPVLREAIEAYKKLADTKRSIYMLMAVPGMPPLGVDTQWFKDTAKAVKNMLKYGEAEEPKNIKAPPTWIWTKGEGAKNISKALVRYLTMPIWVAEKYPGFGSIYKKGVKVWEGVWDVINRVGNREYREHITFFNDQVMNGWNDTHALPDSKWQKIVLAAETLNEKEPQKGEVPDAVLKRAFDMDDQTLKVYKQIRHGYMWAQEMKRALDRFLLGRQKAPLPLGVIKRAVSKKWMKSQTIPEEEATAVREVLDQKGPADVTGLSPKEQAELRAQRKAQLQQLWNIPWVKNRAIEYILEKKHDRRLLANFFSMMRDPDQKYAVVAELPPGEATQDAEEVDDEEASLDEMMGEKPQSFPYYATFNSRSEAVAHAEELVKQGYLPALDKDGKRAEKIEVYIRKDPEFVSRYGTRLTESALWDLVEHIGISSDNPIVQKMAKTLRARGFRAHLEKRDLTPGYQWNKENIQRSLAEYVDGVLRLYHKTVSIAEAQDKLEVLRREKIVPPEIISYAEEFLDGWKMGNPHEWQALRNVIYWNQMGFSLRNALQDLTTPFITTYPQIAIELQKAGVVMQPADIEKIFLTGYKHVFDYLAQRAKEKSGGKAVSVFPDSKIPKHWWPLIDKAKAQSVLNPLELEQLGGFVRDPRKLYLPMSQRARQITNIIEATFESSGIINKVTETIRRGSTFLTGLEIGDHYLKLKGNDLFEYAVHFVDLTQSTWGTVNLPLLPQFIRGAAGGTKAEDPVTKTTGFLRRALRLPLIMRGYSIFMLGRDAYVRRSGNIHAIARHYGGMLALSGIRGLPWFALTSSLLYAIYAMFAGDDDSYELKERKIAGPIEKKLGLPLRMITTGPVGAYTGIETARTLGIGDFPPALNKMGELPGAVWSEAKSVGYGMRSLGQGEYGRALQQFPILPSQAASVLRAKQAAEEGVISGGHVTAFKSDISKRDVTMLGTGFTPTWMAEAYERSRAQKEVGKPGDEKKYLLGDVYVRALARGDGETMGRVMNEIMTWNLDHFGADRIEVVPFIQQAILNANGIYPSKKTIIDRMGIDAIYQWRGAEAP